MTVSCYLLQGSWNRKLVKKSKDSKQKYKTDEFTPVEPKSFTKDRKKIIHLRCPNLSFYTKTADLNLCTPRV